MGFLKRIFGKGGAETTPPPAPAPEPAAPPAAPEEQPVEPQEISADELHAALSGDNPPMLIDVREVQELMMEGWIPGAKHLPLSEVQGHLDNIPEILPKDRPLVISCASGMRSYDFGCFLLEGEFEDVANLTGGIHAWAHDRDRGEDLPTLEI